MTKINIQDVLTKSDSHTLRIEVSTLPNNMYMPTPGGTTSTEKGFRVSISIDSRIENGPTQKTSNEVYEVYGNEDEIIDKMTELGIGDFFEVSE